MDYKKTYESPIGTISLASDGTYLVGLWFADGRFYEDILEKENEEKSVPVLEETVRWLDMYFEGEKPNFMPPLLVRGSEFRQEVCRIMEQIPYGKTISYGDIAKEIERRHHKRMSAQAVGNAVGHNPISIIIPCHRVIGAHGNLVGYGGGLERKIALLKLEGSFQSNFRMP